MLNTLEEWERNPNIAGKNVFKQSKLGSMNLIKKPTKLCIIFRSTKWRSIPALQHYFLYKNQIIYTASILDTCYINFFLIQIGYKESLLLSATMFDLKHNAYKQQL